MENKSVLAPILFLKKHTKKIKSNNYAKFLTPDNSCKLFILNKLVYYSPHRGLSLNEISFHRFYFGGFHPGSCGVRPTFSSIFLSDFSSNPDSLHHKNEEHTPLPLRGGQLPWESSSCRHDRRFFRFLFSSFIFILLYISYQRFFLYLREKCEGKTSFFRDDRCYKGCGIKIKASGNSGYQRLKAVFVVYLFDSAEEVVRIMVECQNPILHDGLIEYFLLVLHRFQGKEIIAHHIGKTDMGRGGDQIAEKKEGFFL